MSTYILAFLAGLLSILSPCVLPLVPIVFASSLTAHRYGPAALAGGLSMSFVAIGMFMATIGFAIGLNSDHFRIVAGLVMIMLGLLLLSQFLQDRFTILVTPLSSFLSSWFKPAATTGLWSQFGVGLLLGAVWSPCVGPTLGAASVLASQGKDLPDVALTMSVFGLGAALPLIVLSQIAQSRFNKARQSLFSTSRIGKKIMGTILLLVGILIVSGLDKRVEAYLVDISPDWLTKLTTQF